MTDVTHGARQTVLVTGASGFIGRNLTKALLAQGADVRVMTRHRDGFTSPEEASVIEGDVLKPETLQPALYGVDTAYYLVHSMTGSRGETDFSDRDRRGAENFLHAASQADVRRIVYLGALGGNQEQPDGHNLSVHLSSRIEVGRMFIESDVPSTVFGAAMIIGAGSAAFEMLRLLVDRLPFMITPLWLETRIQPIAIADVISYLITAPSLEQVRGYFDIAGPDVLSYREMMDRYAHIAGIRSPIIVRVPVLTPRLSALWVDLVTRMPSSLTHPLLEGMRNPLIADTSAIDAVVSLERTSFDEAVRVALYGDHP